MDILPAKKVIYAGVEFGAMTRDGHCVNVGICRMTSEEYAHRNLQKPGRQCRRAVAQIQVSDDGRLGLFFSRHGMLPCTERAIFKPGYFPVPVAYRLPLELLAQLPDHTITEIPSGKYPVQATANGYFIRF